MNAEGLTEKQIAFLQGFVNNGLAMLEGWINEMAARFREGEFAEVDNSEVIGIRLNAQAFVSKPVILTEDGQLSVVAFMRLGGRFFVETDEAIEAPKERS
jgi:hypothetical protein